MSKNLKKNRWKINVTHHLRHLHEALFCTGSDRMSMYDNVTLSISLTGTKCNRDYNEVTIKSPMIFPKDKMERVFDIADLMLSEGLLNLINATLSYIGFATFDLKTGYCTEDAVIQTISMIHIKFIPEDSPKYRIDVDTIHCRTTHRFSKEEADRLVIEESICKGQNNSVCGAMGQPPTASPFELCFDKIENGPSAASLIAAIKPTVTDAEVFETVEAANSNYRGIDDATLAGQKFSQYLNDLIIETHSLIIRTDTIPKSIEVRWSPRPEYLNIVDENGQSISYGFGLEVDSGNEEALLFVIIGHLLNLISDCLNAMLDRRHAADITIKFPYEGDWEDAWEAYYCGLIFKPIKG